MATTVRKLLTGALRLINVVQANETPAADDMDITLQSLQGMMDSWSNDSYMIYTMNPYNFNTVGGQQEYTLGVGGDWDVERPMQINQAYVHYQAGGSQPIDMPITLANDAQWASIAVKSVQTTFPTVLYDNGNYPLRTISLWPIPVDTQEITLWLWQPLLNFANLDQEITLPPGYERAIRFSLAVEIAPEFGKTLGDDIIAKAIKAKAELKSLNAVPQYQNFDQSLQGKRTSYFNWLTGNFVPFR
jgi:hypothetical protein